MRSKILAIFVILIAAGNSLKISSGIIGGKEAGRVGLTQDYKRVVHTTTEFPYSAMLEQDGEFICGAVIVNINAVLTAAHCVFNVYALHLKVRAGTFVKQQNGDDVQVLKVAKKIIHHKYEDDGEDYDIAVLKLVANFHFDEYVNAARLPVAGWGEPYKNTEAIALGYGQVADNKLSKTLRRAMVKVLSRRECLLKDPSLTERMLCTVGANGPAGLNCGDSGSPLIAHHNPEEPYKDVIIGIASFAMNCNPKKHSVYVNIVKLRDWIMSRWR